MINMGHVMRYNDVGRKCSNITCSQLILAHDHEINRNVMKTDLRFLGTTRYNQIFKPMLNIVRTLHYNSSRKYK